MFPFYSWCSQQKVSSISFSSFAGHTLKERSKPSCFPQNTKKVSQALENVESECRDAWPAYIDQGITSSMEKQDFLFSSLFKLKCLLFHGEDAASFCIRPRTLLFAMLTSCHMLFRGPKQPAQHLAGQAQNLLSPNHKICFVLILVLNFVKHIRKAHEEKRKRKPKNRVRLLHCEHPIEPGVSPGAKRREYGKAIH